MNTTRTSGNTKLAAIRDDNFPQAKTGMTEDLPYAALDLLANDAGGAHLVGLMGNVDTTPDGKNPLFTLSVLGAQVFVGKDGSIQYDGSKIASTLNALAQGEILQDSFAYLAQMGKGATGAAQVNVEILGVNDAPRAANYVFKMSDSPDQDATRETVLTWTAFDPDNGASFVFKPVYVESSIGSFRLEASGAATRILKGEAIDALRQGESATLTTTIHVEDEHGATGSGLFLTYVSGVNDIASFSGDLGGTIDLDTDGALNGRLVVSDRDHDESFVGSIQAKAPDVDAELGLDWLPGFRGTDAIEAVLQAVAQEGALKAEDGGTKSSPTGLVAVGQFGSLSVQISTGIWYYLADRRAGEIGADETVHDTFVVTSLDGKSTVEIQVTLIGKTEHVMLEDYS